jgi:drug/metabolite transporter (DMT)-like permease
MRVTVSRGLLAMAESALFFSLMSVCVKLAGARLPFQELVLTRGVVTLALSAFAVWRARVSPWGVNKKLLALRGVLGFCGLNCYYYSLTVLPLADATVIQYTNPVITALLSGVLLGERAKRHELALAVVALFGVVLVSRPSFLFASLGPALPPFGVIVSAAGAVFSALAYVSVRRLARTDRPEVIVFYFPLLAVPLTLPTIAGHVLVPSGREWVLLVLLGVFTQLGQERLTRGLQLEPAGRATAMSYLQIVFAFGWGLAFFGERPAWLTVLGAGCIVASAVGLAVRRT